MNKSAVMPSAKQLKSPKTSGPRAIMFCWGNPKTIPAVSEFLNHLRQTLGLETLIITDNFLGQLAFSAAGIWALRVAEILGQKPLELKKIDLKILANLADREPKAAFNWLSPQSRPQTPDEIYTETQRLLEAYAYVFEKYDPNVVFVWNGWRLIQAALVSQAKERSLPVFYLERGLLPGFLCVDACGVNYASHLAGKNWPKLNFSPISPTRAGQLLDFVGSFISGGKSVVNCGRELGPQALRQTLAVPKEDLLVLLPLQLESDSNIVCFSPNFGTMPDLIRTVRASLATACNVTLIIKPHPEDPNPTANLDFSTGIKTVLCDDIRLDSLLKAADLVVTINSTVGFEALLHQKPVVVLGQALYSEKGLTLDVNQVSDLPAAINKGLSNGAPFDAALLFRFLNYLLSNCLWPISDKDVWGGKANLTAQIATASGLPNPSALSAPPPSMVLQTPTNPKPALSQHRFTNRNIFHEGTLAQKLVRFLRISPTHTHKAFIVFHDGKHTYALTQITAALKHIFPESQIRLLSRQNALSLFWQLLRGKICGALALGKPCGLRRLLWLLLPLRRKIVWTVLS